VDLHPQQAAAVGDSRFDEACSMADCVGDQLAEDEFGVLGVFAKSPAEERLADLVAGVPGLG
jgi:hypothetical protein